MEDMQGVETSSRPVCHRTSHDRFDLFKKKNPRRIQLFKKLNILLCSLFCTLGVLKKPSCRKVGHPSRKSILFDPLLIKTTYEGVRIRADLGGAVLNNKNCKKIIIRFSITFFFILSLIKKKTFVSSNRTTIDRKNLNWFENVFTRVSNITIASNDKHAKKLF